MDIDKDGTQVVLKTIFMTYQNTELNQNPTRA